MVGRSRSKSVGFIPGGSRDYTTPSGTKYTITAYDGPREYSTMSDSISSLPWPDRAMTRVIDEAQGVIQSGSYTYSGYVVNYNDYNIPGFYARNGTSGTCPASLPSNSQFWENKALANANPNSADVDLPLFLFELKDFPRLLKNLGDTYATLRRNRVPDISSGYVAYRFGWAPMVSDLIKLLKFAELTDRRARYLQEIASGKGKRVARKLGAQDNTPYTRTKYSGSQFYSNKIRVQETWSGKQDAWYVARVKLLNGLPTTSSERLAYANRLVLGLSGRDQAFSTLWNAMPWSWLIDYFFDIGTVIEAYQGRMEWKMGQLNLMIRDVSTCNQTLLENSTPTSLQMKGGSRTIKRRFIVPNPSARVTFSPLLSGSQIAILAALATTGVIRNGSWRNVPSTSVRDALRIAS